MKSTLLCCCKIELIELYFQCFSYQNRFDLIDFLLFAILTLSLQSFIVKTDKQLSSNKQTKTNKETSDFFWIQIQVIPFINLIPLNLSKLSISKSLPILIPIPDSFSILPIAFPPIILQCLDSNSLIAQFPAAFLKDHPFELMVNCKNNLNQHNGRCINSDGD